MSRFLLSLFISLSFVMTSMACSVIPHSFCNTPTYFPESIIVSGQIIAVDNDGIDLQIISVLKGVETNSTIRIWDGTDFDCNGPWSMASSNLGSLNDTIVVLLPKIEVIENSWDVIGDYRRPDYFGYTSNLIVKDGIVKGFIKGFAGDPNSVFEYWFESFNTSWMDENDCSGIALNNNELDKNKLVLSYNNPINEILNIDMGKALNSQVSIYNLQGQKIKTFSFTTKEIDINLSKYTSGMYYVSILLEDNQVKSFKVIKQ